MFTKLLLPALLAGFFCEAHAEMEPWSQFKNLRCREELLKYTQKEGLDKIHYRQHVSSFKSTVFRGHYPEIGNWSEMQLGVDGQVVFYSMNDESVVKNTFDNNCQIMTKKESWPREFEQSLTQKTDEDLRNHDLKELISSGKKGMIYYWSPKFTYSVMELKRMEGLAKKWGYEFSAVVDPRASHELVLETLKKAFNEKEIKRPRVLAKNRAYLRNVATDLYLRSGFNHFPVTYIYNNKNIHPRFITGVMTEGGLKSMAETFSSEMKGSAE